MDIRPTYLLMVTTENNNKFYNLFPQGDTFRVEYGRVDSTHTSRTYPISQWNKILSSKLGKGYKDVTDLRQDLITGSDIDQNGDGFKRIENDSVRSIIEYLQQVARDTVRRHYTISASSVTQTMIDEAQVIIDFLATGYFTVTNFNDKLLELYTVIPRRMTNVKKHLATDAAEFSAILQREQDLLDVMKGQVCTHTNLDNKPIHDDCGMTVLEANGLSFEEASTDDINLIKVLMGESERHFSKAWKVCNKNTQEKFNEFVANMSTNTTKLLFHGSRNENFWSIIKNGLVLRPTNAVITGKMFGYGIYFAPKCQKSIGYTSLSGSYWAGGNSTCAYMAVFEVAYGKPFDVYRHTNAYSNFNYQKLQSASGGADCLHAHTSQGFLRNDEIVVYREDQITIKYLIEIKR